MNIEDLFEKHSTAYYDANEHKTEVLTKRRFERAVAEMELKIFDLEQQIERNRKYHNGTLLMLGTAQHVIDLMKIMLIGAEKQDFIIYPSSDKTPNYLDIIQHKIKEYEQLHRM